MLSNRRISWFLFLPYQYGSGLLHQVVPLHKAKSGIPIQFCNNACSFSLKLAKQSSDTGTANQDDQWEIFKSNLYETLDAVSDVTGKFSGEKGTSPKAESSEVAVAEPTTDESPAQKLLRQYQRATPGGGGGDPDQELTTFDSFKETVYNGVDEVSKIIEPSSSQSLSESEPPLISQNFRPVSQNAVDAPDDIKAALGDLNSSNPIERLKAEFSIKQWEEQKKKREKEQQRQERVAEIKQGLYTVIDTIASGAEMVSSVPEKVVVVAKTTKETADAVVAFAKTVPDGVQTTVETVVTIPSKVEETVNEVQGTVDKSLKQTQQFVADVQSIPSKVQESVDETTRTVNDAVYTVKVFTGLEERKPEPPKLPPPPTKSTEEIALDVTKSVATGVAKAGWWVGKETLKLGWKGASIGASALVSKVSESMASKEVSTPSKDAVAEQKPPIDDKLKKEVEEALNFAENALREADEDRLDDPTLASFKKGEQKD